MFKKVFNKVLTCLTFNNVRDSASQEEKEHFEKMWESFKNKKESFGAKELREQLELVEELKKTPVERWDSRKVPTNLAKFPHYFAKTPNFTHLDIYMVSEMFGLNSYQHHAVKKILAAGKRGAKDKEKDIKEVIATLEAWLEASKYF